MVVDAWRAGLTLGTSFFVGGVEWGGGRGRGREEPICHLDFAAKVPDSCWVLRGTEKSLTSFRVSTIN